jgi:hypothetical protein
MTGPRKPVETSKPTRAELIETHIKAAARREAAAQTLEDVDIEAKRREFQQASEEFEQSWYNLNELYDDVDY